MSTNWLPNYLDQVPTMQFIDPLGAFLTGNLQPAPVTYSFEDVVKMSGHSCPTIAGAYGIVLTAMDVLYGPGEVPVRGEISVECPQSPTDGAMGPLSQAITYLTGACAENGFQGLGGNYRRKGLLTFSGEDREESPFKFTRLDTKKSVGVFYHSDRIPGDPAMGSLFQRSLMGIASDIERQEFGRMWQERVQYVLIKPENRAQVFQVVSLNT